MIDHVHALPEGYRLQEYTITGTLGFGGFGITYSAMDTNLDKVIAIKEYLPSELAVRMDDSFVSAKSGQDRDRFDWGLNRFLDEAKTVAKFDHRNIVKVHRFFQQNGTGYIVMEFIKGRTLSSVLKQKGTLGESEIRNWLWPVMEGLKIVHKAGYLHRDIKPQNIMMRDDGRPCLLDFGAARIAMGGLTRSLTAIMTPGFAPLEQYETKGNQGPWTDIYSLGAVMYSCVAGHKPKDALDRIRSDALEKPGGNFKEAYSHGFLQGITAALSMKEADRPQNIDVLLKILDAPEQDSTLKMPESGMTSIVAGKRIERTSHTIPSGSQASPATPSRSHANLASKKHVTNKSKTTRKWLLIAILPVLIMSIGVFWWINVQEQKPQVKSVPDASSSEGINTSSTTPDATQVSIDSLLESLLENELNGGSLYCEGADNGQEKYASCYSFYAMQKRGCYGRSTYDMKIENSYAMACREIGVLQSAKNPTSSYFDLDSPDWWKSIPAEVIPMPGGVYSEASWDFHAEIRDKLVAGKTLGELNYDKITSGSQSFEMVLDSSTPDCGKSEIHFTVTAVVSADFDGDGVAELMLKGYRAEVSESCEQGSLNKSGAPFHVLVKKNGPAAKAKVEAL